MLKKYWIIFALSLPVKVCGAVSYAVIDNFDIVELVVRSANKQVTTETLFQAGSLTKPVTAILAIKLVGEPDVSLRQLLSMSAGINVPGFLGFLPGEQLPTNAQILAGVTPAHNIPVKQTAPPGKQYRYSGGGYQLVQERLEKRFHKTLAELMHDCIFFPLHLKNSTLANMPAGAIRTSPLRIPEAKAAAGLWSTPKELAKILIALMKAHQGIEQSFLTHKQARLIAARQPNTPYGLGFVVFGRGRSKHLVKLGQNAGFQSWLIGFPALGKGAIVMTNSDKGRVIAAKIIQQIASQYHWPSYQLKDAWMLEH